MSKRLWKVKCANCGASIGWSANQRIPTMYCSGLPCTDYDRAYAERDDLIVLFARDFGYTSTQIMLKLEERGWELSRQHIHQLIKEAGVTAA